MMRHVVLAAAAVGFLGAAGVAAAADRKAKPGAVAGPAVIAVQDCSAFYDDYRERGFTWGSGPGYGLGFGVFEGALPRYPDNEFPNWYGWCQNWGHYSAAGSARVTSGGAAVW